MKTETLLRILPRRWIDMFETATRRLPFLLQQKLLVQMAVRFRKREVGAVHRTALALRVAEA
jgi:hypothetical protein